MKTILELLNYLLDIIFPKEDAVVIAELMSPATFSGLAETASDRHSLSEQNIYPLFSYREPLVRNSIWQIKYAHNRKIARTMGKLLADLIMNDLGDEIEFAGRNKPILIPIPLGQKRLRERDFNQTELICEYLVENLKDAVEYRKDVLMKVRETSSQTKTKSRQERLENLRDCFVVSDPSLVKKRRIILIDDVVTTGATIKEARRTLRASGAKSVVAYTLAH